MQNQRIFQLCTDNKDAKHFSNPTLLNQLKILLHTREVTFTTTISEILRKLAKRKNFLKQ